MSEDCLFNPVPEDVLYCGDKGPHFHGDFQVNLIMELKFTIMLALYSFVYVTYSLRNNVTVHFILNTVSYWLQVV